MAHSNSRKHLTGGIVIDIPFRIVRTAMSMAGVRTKAYIRKNHQIGECLLESRNRPLHNAAHISSGRADLILLAFGLSKKENALYTLRELRNEPIHRPAVLTGH